MLSHKKSVAELASINKMTNQIAAKLLQHLWCHFEVTIS